MLALALLAASCIKPLEYNISSAEEIPVLYAIWSSDVDEHDVYLCTSGPYEVLPAWDDCRILCYVNGNLKADVAEAVSEELSDVDPVEFLHYRIPVHVEEGDRVELEARFPDRVLTASTTVPHTPDLQMDTSSVARESIVSPRLYTVAMTLHDKAGEMSYYRIYKPRGHSWVYDRNGRLKREGELVFQSLIDENAPIFKNISIHFPKDLALEFPFLGPTSTNLSYVFSDELFSDSSYTFTFKTIHFSGKGGYGSGERLENEFIGIVSSISKEEYDYLVALNAAMSSSGDNFAEPVTVPTNIEGGGLGIFTIRNTRRISIAFEPVDLTEDDPYLIP